MSKILMAGVAAASLFAAAPVFAQGAPQNLIQQAQRNGYQVYAETHQNPTVMNAQAQQAPNAPQFATNATAVQSGAVVQR